MRPFVALLFLSSLVASACGHAAEIKVLTAGAFKPVVMATAGAFEAQSGHRLVVENDTAGALLKRISEGEAFDVAILTLAAVKELTEKGRIAPGSAANLARTSVGVAVKQGAPLPDIATVAAFKAALIAATKVAYIDPAAGGSSGIYFSRLLETMGIADAVRAKAVLVPGGLVAQRLVTGEADLAIHQISEILAVKGGGAGRAPAGRDPELHGLHRRALGGGEGGRGCPELPRLPAQRHRQARALRQGHGTGRRLTARPPGLANKPLGESHASL